MSSRDILIYGSGQSDEQAALLAWAQNAPGLHLIPAPDYHRLQLERWVWEKQEALGKIIMDVGQDDTPRRWLGKGYFTFGFNGCDVKGDLLDIPLESNSIDGVICTEVFEHCKNPFIAITELRRVMKPGALLLLTSPFFWPDHHTAKYPDFWRFTRQGWELLLAEFEQTKIEAFKWTDEGAVLYDLMRRFECFGHTTTTEATTGYRCEAKK